MTVWCHLPTIFNQRYALRIAGLLTLCVALTTTLLFSVVSHAAPGVNKTLSFQGRLQNTSGAVVPDGYYNIQFKIYQDGDGAQAGNTGGVGGALKWTETYVNNNGTNGIQVKNGYFSVNLGSKSAFGSNIDWNQDTLWLSMNVAGSAANCTTFSSCAPDGEMLPMKRITATPFAINSAQLGGKTADNFIQLAQGVQTDTSNNTSSIYLNKTGTGGNFLRLQNAGVDALTIANNGDLTFGSIGGGTHYLSVADAPADTGGDNLFMKAGKGGSGNTAGGSVGISGGDGGIGGGSVIIQGGSSPSGLAGNVIIDSGVGSSGTVTLGNNYAGSILIGSGNSSTNQTISIGSRGGAGSSTTINIGGDGSTASGTTNIRSKDDTTFATNGTQRARFSSGGNTLYVGNADASGQAATANSFTIQGTSSTGSNTQGGSITLQAGSATSGNANGGNINLTAGSGSGTGATGLVVLGTPAFKTAGSQSCASNCTLTQGNLDSNGALIVNATAGSVTATLPDPTVATAGRVIYITAANASYDFKLAMNGGGTKVAVRQNTTVTVIWNGSDWTVAGNTSSSSLQDTYDSVNGTQSVHVGDGVSDGSVTMLTLDHAAAAPTVSDALLLGSMYYDTTIGKVRCYEADGWGACGSSPDNIITLTPEYNNAVMHGTGVGTMTSDFCSDTLDINDGSSSQPTVCGTNETYNFYKWTSSQASAQTYSVYVTYQLPSTFSNFAAGSTSLKGRTDSSNSSVAYQVYRSHGSGLTACGSAVSVSTGSQSSWQTGTASGSADPSNCSFAAGDSIVFKITVSANSNANAYVGNLRFTYSNN